MYKMININTYLWRLQVISISLNLHSHFEPVTVKGGHTHYE